MADFASDLVKRLGSPNILRQFYSVFLSFVVSPVRPVIPDLPPNGFALAVPDRATIRTCHTIGLRFRPLLVSGGGPPPAFLLSPESGPRSPRMDHRQGTGRYRLTARLRVVRRARRPVSERVPLRTWIACVIRERTRQSGDPGQLETAARQSQARTLGRAHRHRVGMRRRAVGIHSERPRVSSPWPRLGCPYRGY